MDGEPNNSNNLTQDKVLIMKGGGAKGIAYIGALKEIIKYYDFNWFVGTSAGAITASLLAVGYSPDELEDILFDKDFGEFKDARFWKIPTNFIFRHGLYQGNKLTNWIRLLASKKANELGCDLQGSSVLMKDLSKFPHHPRLTVYACSKFAEDGTLVIDSDDSESGNFLIGDAVRASVAIPLFFTPVRHFNMRVWDGGMKNNYPVKKLLEDNPDIEFIGLYLGSKEDVGDDNPESWRAVLADLFHIWGEINDITALRKYNKNTIIIDPSPIKTVDFNLTKFEKEFLLRDGKASALEFLLRQGLLNDSQTYEVKKARKIAERIRFKLNKVERIKRNIKMILILIVSILLLLYTIWLNIPSKTEKIKVAPSGNSKPSDNKNGEIPSQPSNKGDVNSSSEDTNNLSNSKQSPEDLNASKPYVSSSNKPILKNNNKENEDTETESRKNGKAIKTSKPSNSPTTLATIPNPENEAIKTEQFGGKTKVTVGNVTVIVDGKVEVRISSKSTIITKIPLISDYYYYPTDATIEVGGKVYPRTIGLAPREDEGIAFNFPAIPCNKEITISLEYAENFGEKKAIFTITKRDFLDCKAPNVDLDEYFQNKIFCPRDICDESTIRKRFRKTGWIVHWIRR